jgi:hypothetical protein
MFVSSKWFLPFRFPHHTPNAFLFSPLRAIHLAYLILLDLMTGIMFDDDCGSWSTLWQNSLQFPVTSSLLGPSIFLSAICYKVSSLCSSFSFTGQVSQAYNTTSKITVLNILTSSYTRHYCALHQAQCRNQINTLFYKVSFNFFPNRLPFIVCSLKWKINLYMTTEFYKNNSECKGLIFRVSDGETRGTEWS